MFYKNDDNIWSEATEVHFPDGEKLTVDNKNSRDGWTWSDEPPQEFIAYQATQNEIL